MPLPRPSPRKLFLASMATFYVLAALGLWYWLEPAPSCKLASDHPLRFVSFSPDGRYVAAIQHREWNARSDGTHHVCVWDAATGQLHHCWELPRENGGGRRLIGNSGPCCAFSPDGRWFAAQNAEHDVCVWSVDTGQKMFQHDAQRHEDKVSEHRFAFAPDSRTLAIAEFNRLHLVDTVRWHKRSTLDVDNEKKSFLLCQLDYPDFDTEKVVGQDWSHMVFSPDGQTLIYQTDRKRNPDCRVWFLFPCTPVFIPWLLEITVDERWRTIALKIACASGQVTTEYPDVICKEISPDNRTGLFSLVSANRCVLLELQTGKVVLAPTMERGLLWDHSYGHLKDHRYCRDGQTLLALALKPVIREQAQGPFQGHLIAWDLSVNPPRSITCLECRANYWWDPAMVIAPNGDWFSHAELNSPNEEPRQFLLTHIPTGVQSCVLDTSNHIEQVTFAPDHRHMAVDTRAAWKKSAFDNWYWSLHKKVTGKWPDFDYEEYTRRKVTQSICLTVLDLPSGQPRLQIPGHYLMDFSPDGSKLATLTPHYAIHIWFLPPQRPWLMILGLPLLPISLVGWRVLRR